MDHRFSATSEKLADAPHPKLIVELTFPYEGGINHADLDEALVEASFVVLAAFEDGKIGSGEVEDSLGNKFLSWRLEKPGEIGETPTVEGALAVLKSKGVSPTDTAHRIRAIKVLRAQWALGLIEARNLYDSLEGK